VSDHKYFRSVYTTKLFAFAGGWFWRWMIIIEIMNHSRRRGDKWTNTNNHAGKNVIIIYWKVTTQCLDLFLWLLRLD